MFTQQQCPNCLATFQEGQKFCGKCGIALQHNRSLQLNSNAQQADEDTFAWRISLQDFKTKFHTNDLQIPPKSRAYFFNQSQYIGDLEIGENAVESILKGYADLNNMQNIEAVIVREPSLNLAFNYFELLSKDYLPLNLMIHIQTNIIEPEKFINHYMLTQQTISTNAISELLQLYLKQALSQQLAQKKVTDLINIKNIYAQLTYIIKTDLSQRLSHYGISITKIIALQITPTQYNENNKLIAITGIDDSDNSHVQAQQIWKDFCKQETLQAIKNLKHSRQINYLLRKVKSEEKNDAYMIQLKEFDLLEHISKAQTREQAVKPGVQQAIATLEQQIQNMGEVAQIQWQHIKKLAQIERDRKLALIQAINRHELERCRLENQHYEDRQVRQIEIDLAQCSLDPNSRRFLVQLEREQHQEKHSFANFQQRFEAEKTVKISHLAQTIKAYQQSSSLETGLFSDNNHSRAEIALTNATSSLSAAVRKDNAEKFSFRKNRVKEPLKPTLYVLAIGNSNYQDETINDLTYPSKDAYDFSQIMQQQQGMYREVQIKQLIDATRNEMISGLDWLLAEVTDKDIAMFFFTGHGAQDKFGNYQLISADANPFTLHRSCISAKEIQETLSHLAGKRFAFLDSCFSGNLMGTNIRSFDRMIDMDAIAKELASVDSGVIVFSSSTGKQVSLESKKWENGAFTKALIEGINGGANYKGDGKITYQLLSSYIVDRVKELTDNTQTPTLTIPESMPDFPIAIVR